MRHVDAATQFHQQECENVHKEHNDQWDQFSNEFKLEPLNI